MAGSTCVACDPLSSGPASVVWRQTGGVYLAIGCGARSLRANRDHLRGHEGGNVSLAEDGGDPGRPPVVDGVGVGPLGFDGGSCLDHRHCLSDWLGGEEEWVAVRVCEAGIGAGFCFLFEHGVVLFFNSQRFICVDVTYIFL